MQLLHIFKAQFLFSLFLSVVVFGLPVQWAFGQETSDNKIHTVAREDGRAFVYHAELIPLSHGFNVYRSANGEDWEKLTGQPFYPAADGYEFRKMVGDSYSMAEQIADRGNPQAVFLRLRSRSGTGILASFAMPEVARAVGRLYIDENAPVGETVFYRFEIVDDLGRTIDEQIEGRTTLQPIVPPAPSQLEVTNEAEQVTVNWNYVPNRTPAAKNVIRFQIYYREKGSDELVAANKEFLARTKGDTEYKYIFDIPGTGKEYTFTVHAVDFTGRMSEPSDETTIRIVENVPPSIVRNVKATKAEGYASHITWPVSTELDLAGYHLYRASGDEESYTRLTTDLMDPLETAYLDSTVEPGTQYRYAVTAVDTSGNEGPRSNAGYVFISDNRVPDPVSAFTVNYTDEQTVKLNWEQGKIPGKLRTYFLLRRQIHPRSGRSFTQINKEQLTVTNFLDKGVGDERFIEGAVYEYGISVISENGKASDTVYTELKIPDLTPPEPPAFIEAKMQKGRRVSLRWDASSSTDVTRYRIYRSAPGASADSIVAEVLRGNRYYRDEQVDFGNTYLYSVTAVDSLDNESIDAPVDTLHARRLTPPVPVRNLQAMETEQGVQLRWEKSTDEQVVGYRIYKSSLATGIYETVGETADNTVGWVDEEGSAGTWYKVFPVDQAGREARTAKPTQAVENNSR